MNIKPKVLTFDLEIRKMIPQKLLPKEPNLDYCKGWTDYAGMGISFGGAYLDWIDEYRLYGEENLGALINDMEQSEIITGYNIIKFDIPLLKTVWAKCWAKGTADAPGLDSSKPPEIPTEKVYDPFHDIKKSLGNNFPKGWSLDNVAKSNLSNISKNGDGSMAPVLFQRQHLAELATYVIQDVKVEKSLFNYCWDNGTLKNESNGQVVKLNGMERLKKLWAEK